MGKGKKHPKKSSATPAAQAQATITMSPDELKKIIAEAIVEADKQKSATDISGKAYTYKKKNSSCSIFTILKYILFFPFIPNWKFMDIFDPFPTFASMIAQGISVLLYSAFVVVLILIFNPSFGLNALGMPVSTLIAFLFLLYIFSFWFKALSSNFEKREDASLSLAFLSLVIAVLALFL